MVPKAVMTGAILAHSGRFRSSREYVPCKVNMGSDKTPGVGVIGAVAVDSNGAIGEVFEKRDGNETGPVVERHVAKGLGAELGGGIELLIVAAGDGDAIFATRG